MMEAVDAPLAYLVRDGARAEHRIYPPNSGRPLVRPEQRYYTMPVHDARGMTPAPRLRDAGFELVRHATQVDDLYDNDKVRAIYYDEVVALLKAATGALEVVVFDHNQRSARRAAAGEHGIRTPVDAAHVDYTPASGPRRAREILADAGLEDLGGHRLALVNVWRPVIGPVEDVPLALCDARSTRREDFVATDIHHFGEDDLEHPRHSGEIYSLCHSSAHRWYFFSHMQADEVLLLMNWDSADDQHQHFMPHTGFRNPSPADAPPRESIEARTLVVLPD